MGEETQYGYEPVLAFIRKQQIKKIIWSVGILTKNPLVINNLRAC
jgi:hypothetical protein